MFRKQQAFYFSFICKALQVINSIYNASGYNNYEKKSVILAVNVFCIYDSKNRNSNIISETFFGKKFRST